MAGTTPGIQEDQPQTQLKTILCLDRVSQELCSLIDASTEEWVTDRNCAKLGAGYRNWGSLDLRGTSNRALMQVLRYQQPEEAAVEVTGLFALLPDCSTTLPVQILAAMMAILPLPRTDILFISKHL